jgi:hypothetical protein
MRQVKAELVSSRPEAEQHLVVVSNPAASTASEMEPRLHELKNLDCWDSVAHIDTAADGSHTKKLQENIRPNSKIVIAGGDGTAKRIIDSLEDLLTDYNYRKVEFIIAGAGNKNDIAHMLSGQHYNNPLEVWKRGKKRKIYPIEAIFTDSEGNQRVERALYSFSIGTTATAAQMFNSASFKERQKARGPKGKWIGERMLALKSIISTQAISTDRGKALDITVAGGQRMAGGALRFDTLLSNPSELVIAHTKPNLASVVGNIIGRKLSFGPEDLWVYGHDTITVYSDAPAQADGEVIEEIKAGTSIRLQRARRGISVIALQD